MSPSSAAVCPYAPRALPPAQADALIALIDGLEAVAEAGAMIPLMVAA